MRLLSTGVAVSCILEGGDPEVGPMTLKFELGLEFLTAHLLTKFYHAVFNRSENIVLKNKQTNRDSAETIHIRQWKTTFIRLLSETAAEIISHVALHQASVSSLCDGT